MRAVRPHVPTLAAARAGFHRGGPHPSALVDGGEETGLPRKQARDGVPHASFDLGEPALVGDAGAGGVADVEGVERGVALGGDAGEVDVAAVVRHLPVGGDAVSTVVAGAPHAMVGVAARSGLGRIEVPVIFQTAGALRLTVSRVGAADPRAAELAFPLDEVVVGAGVHERAATRPRPWHGESRVRPVWLGVEMAGLDAGERYALTLEAADGAVVTVWRAQPDAGTAGAAASDGSAGAGSAEALARIELYDP